MGQPRDWRIGRKICRTAIIMKCNALSVMFEALQLSPMKAEPHNQCRAEINYWSQCWDCHSVNVLFNDTPRHTSSQIMFLKFRLHWRSRCGRNFNLDQRSVQASPLIIFFMSKMSCGANRVSRLYMTRIVNPEVSTTF